MSALDTKISIVVVCVFIWIGFIGAISFMEAWIKFRAPGITLPLGLGIGKLVFFALNKMEWLFSLIIIISLLYARNPLNFNSIFFLIPFVILLIQTFWLLPILDARADLHIQGEVISSSFHHFYYVGLETIKLVSLFIFGIKLLTQ